MTTDCARDETAINRALELQHTLYKSRNPARRWLHLSRVQWIIDHAAAYGKTAREPIVDVGAGCGAILPELSELFHAVLGIDKQPLFLKDAGTSPIVGRGQIHLAAGDLRSLPLQEDAAGVVICSEVLEHIKAPQACLNEIYRVLAPGGILILSTPQPFSLVEIIGRIAFSAPVLPLAKRIYREPIAPTGHINLMSMKTVTRQLSRAGFAILKTHRSGLYLPGISDLRSDRIQQVTRRLNAKLMNTRLAPLLWTQFFVAQKPQSAMSSKKEQPRIRR